MLLRLYWNIDMDVAQEYIVWILAKTPPLHKVANKCFFSFLLVHLYAHNEKLGLLPSN